MDDKIRTELIRTALAQLPFAYVPYSKFHVGAALLAENGAIYTGCNIENASYGATNCAERTAFFKAVSEGVKKFRAICIVGGQDGVVTGFAAPCGICRQVMSEFCDADSFRIILAIDENRYQEFLLKELLPGSFDGEFLKKS